MYKRRQNPPPRWFFSILSTGALIACGIYLGIIHVEGASAVTVVKSIGYGLLGIVMMWGVLGKRDVERIG